MLKKVNSFYSKGAAWRFDLVKSKEEILTCMADNIDDQNSSTSLMGLMSAFDLT